MKITIKNLRQQTFQIIIDESKTVRNLKEEIELLKGPEYNVDLQKLIYCGKVLDDNSLLSSIGFNEKKFIVVMVCKPKPSVTIEAELSPTEGVQEKVQEGTVSNTPAEMQRNHVTITPPTSLCPNSAVSTSPVLTEPVVTVTRNVNAENLLRDVMGSDYQNMINNIISMGYSREQVEQALHVNYNDPQRTTEFLVIGLPEQGASEDPSTMSIDVVVDPNSENPLEQLRQQPQFQQMCSVIHQNPSILNSVLEQIGQSNPSLLNLINQHQESFVHILNESGNNMQSPHSTPGTTNMIENNPGQITPLQMESITETEQYHTPMQRPRTELIHHVPEQNTPFEIRVGTHGNPDNPSIIQITQKDKDVIEKLTAMGYPQNLVIQAYFACDKDESLTANFLLTQNSEEES